MMFPPEHALPLARRLPALMQLLAQHNAGDAHGTCKTNEIDGQDARSMHDAGPWRTKTSNWMGSTGG
jgi:hypothetical protein